MRIGFGDALYEAAGGQSPLPQAGEGLGERAPARHALIDSVMARPAGPWRSRVR
jgi:hypothetical protein